MAKPLSKTLRPNLERFFNFISTKSEGDVVTDHDLLAAAGWEPATLRTHRDKNAFSPFLTTISPGKYRVRRDGASISKSEVAQAFTQIRPADFVLSAGTRLRAATGDFELLSELGTGAVAHVWRAKRILNGKSYALKIMNPRADLLNPATFENVKHRFSREARNGPKLVHDNIVAYVDMGDYQSHPFLVMELADESLASKITVKLLSVSESIDVVGCCALGLQHLHEKDCVHRDVKPHNILCFGSRFVLGDLGIVNWSDMNPAFTSAGTITKDSLQLGSWYYMAPEQRSSPHEATAMSDVYALGVSWYEMLTGNTPDPAAIAAQMFTDPCGNEDVNSIIRRMLRFNPRERPSVAELLTLMKTIR